MKVAFRADGGGGGFGIGHLMRCISLAEVLKKKNYSLFFITKEYPAGINLLRDLGIEVRSIPTSCGLKNDLIATKQLIEDASIVILDSYQFDSNYYESLKLTTRYLVAFDDLIDRKVPVQMIIGNCYASQEKYKKWILPNTMVLGGMQHIPIRQEFADVPKRQVAKKVERIFISFGGEDPRNMTTTILTSINKIQKKYEIDIVIGPAYQHKEELLSVIKNSPHKCHLHSNVREIIALYKQADLAIVPPSSTLWECASVGVPAIVVQIGEHQKQLIEFLKENDLTYVAESHTITNALQEMESAEVRQNYSNAMQQQIDGKGAERIVTTILEEFKKHVWLRPATATEDSKFIWIWRNDPLTRKMSRHSEEISWEKHKEWYQHVIQENDKLLYMACLGITPIGMIRLDRLNDHKAEININMNPDYRAKGLGKKVLENACTLAFQQFQQIHAVIKNENLASIKIFEAVGFRLERTEEEFCYYSFP